MASSQNIVASSVDTSYKSTVGDCANGCNNLNNCGGFEYNPSTGYCKLYYSIWQYLSGTQGSPWQTCIYTGNFGGGGGGGYGGGYGR